MRKYLFGKVLTIIIFCFLFASLSHGATVNVSAQDYSFIPSTVTINVGDTVVWTNFVGMHTTTSGSGCVPNGIWDSGTGGGGYKMRDLLTPGQSFSYTFNTAGTYPYFCQFHCDIGMTGTVIVMQSNIIQVPNSGEQSSIQIGYLSAVTGDTIQIQAGTFEENDDFNSNVSVALVGGYDSSFSTDSSNSLIKGTLTVSAGTVTIKNIIIQ